MLSSLVNTLLLMTAVHSGTDAEVLDYGYKCPSDPFRGTFISMTPRQVKVAFLVHNAGYIPEQNFRLLSHILAGLHEYYTDRYGPGYNLGICSFSETAQWRMPMHEPLRPWQINISSYINLNDKTSGTSIDLGFQTVEEELYRFAYNVTVAPNVCVLLTTSPPDNTSLATAAAESLKNSGVNVVVIAVGNDVDEEDIADLATSTKLVFTTSKRKSNSDENLKLTAADVASNFSRVWAHAHVLPKYTWCYEASISAVIIVDVRDGYIQALAQLRDFLIEFNMVYTSVRIMMINSPTDDDNFLEFLHSIRLDTRDVKFEIYDSTYKLRSSIESARQNLLRPPNLKENIVIFVTDRKVDNINDIIVESQACQESGIHVMALGVGTEVLEDQLSQIITDPKGITTVKSLEDFTFGLRKLYRNLCPAAVCHKGWVYHEGMCSSYQPKEEPWLTSQKVCGELRARLVSITTPEKYAWLKTEFLDKYNKSTHIGLQKHSVTNARNGRELRWENEKPLVFSDWSRKQTPPEPDGAGYEECVAWYPDGWRDVVCTVVIGAGYICEREADNATKQAQKGVEILPLWNEHVCPVPVSGFDEDKGPILVTGNQCRPLLSVVWKHHEIRDIFNCSNGELIAQFLLCDGVSHCQDESDEKHCTKKCTEYQFHCLNDRCVSLAYFCDFWDDCGDSSDEDNCAIPPCESHESWQCNSGQCVPSTARCDLYFDCYDGSDEKDCADKCEEDVCDDGTCIPRHWAMDGEVDCGGGRCEDEVTPEISQKQWKNTCYRGRYREISYLFTNARYSNERPNCTMVFDGFGKHFESFTAASQDCGDENILCPIGFYRCPSSYCLPIERVCDGVMDCIDGEEEEECGNYECPGYYRCPGTRYCLHPSRICDGDVDCPGGKDEVMCEAKCPSSCSCFAGVVDCRNIVINESSPFDPLTRKIVVTDSQLLRPDDVFKGRYFVKDVILSRVGLFSVESIFDDQINLIKLNVSQNSLDVISSRALSSLRRLQILDLSHNPLTNLSSSSFTGLRNLQELYMKYTSIEILEQGSFSALVNLKVLDMTGKSVHVIKDKAFGGLGHLSVLYMQGNIITSFGQRVFDGLKRLEEFHTDIYSLCCSQVRPISLHQSKCISPRSSISSCKDLLANDFLRSSIWILCVASLIGNLMSTMMRFVWERNSMKNGFGVFVTHLGIADFLMGVYLLIIAVADTMYKGTYIWHEFTWRQNHFCKLAGTLSALSSEASTFFICLITLDRFLIIKFPFGQLKFRYKSATMTATLAWILALIIAIIPLFPSVSHWSFYNKNGACLALPFSTERTPGWIYSVTIFTGLNFVAFIVIALGQLSIYRAMTQASLITSKERRAQDIAVARRLLLIVATDFLCWFPVGILSILALNGVSLDGAVYAWTAVFILPINSALNPFLYTIPAIMQKMRNGQKSTVSKQATELSEVQPRVRIGDPDPREVLLEDALRQLKTTQEKIQLMKDIWGGVTDCLVTRTSEQHQPNTIYLSMRGKVVDTVSLATRNDTSNIDLITAVMTFGITRPDTRQKADCDNRF